MSTENPKTTASGKVRQYGNEKRDAKEPFRFTIGDSPEFTVHEPDAGTVMDIEEARTSRAVLQLFLGSQYGQLEEHLESQHPDTMVELARDLSRHFGLFETQPSVNRAERRRKRRA